MRPVSSQFLLLNLIALLLCALTGCQSVLRCSIRPNDLHFDAIPESRSTQVQIDHRLLGTPIDAEHTVTKGDVLGIYIADVLGDREELPQVAYPSFRTKNSPIEPFVGQPIKVESDGTIKLPYVSPIQVEGMSLPKVRDAISKQYVNVEGVVKEGRSNVFVSLITPRFHRIYVVRQDTRYNMPGLITTREQEISRRWSGTTLYLEPKECSVLTALMRTGGLPGIDAQNELWVMKGIPKEDLQDVCIPMLKKLEGPSPMMIPKSTSKLIRIPLMQQLGEELPFSQEDVVLGDGDVVFLPRRDGDHFMTGGMLPSGRYPLPRDRDLDILEAIAISTGPQLGPGSGTRPPNYAGGGKGILPPTDVVIIRRLSTANQIKIHVDLKRCLDDPSERVRIAPGDLILLKFKKREMVGNIAMNLFNLNFTLSRVLGATNGTTIIQ
jgi:hypothetical protein